MLTTVGDRAGLTVGELQSALSLSRQIGMLFSVSLFAVCFTLFFYSSSANSDCLGAADVLEHAVRGGCEEWPSFCDLLVRSADSGGESAAVVAAQVFGDQNRCVYMTMSLSETMNIHS